jgi:hypothetical protein
MDAVTRPKGKVWRKMRTGDGVGQPLAKWAYVTPDTPSGITQTQVALSDRETQLHVMECWFRANYQAGEGNERVNLDRAMAVPSQALELLTTEFAGTVPDGVIAELAERLYSQGPINWVPTPPPLTADAYAARVMERLAGLEAALSKIASASRGIGDNNPPEPMLAVPLSAEDRDAAADAIREVRSQLTLEKPDTAAIERAAGIFQGLRNKLAIALEVAGALSLNVAGNMVTPLAERALHDLEALIPELWHWIQATFF